MEIKIDVNDELLKHNSSTPDLTSMFMYLEHDGECYPCDDWIDNPCIVLGWWLHSIKDLLQGGEGQGINFMEGPYFISVIPDDDKMKLVSEDGEISWELKMKEFASALIKGMNKASLIFHKMGMQAISDGLNQDVKELKALIE